MRKFVCISVLMVLFVAGGAYGAVNSANMSESLPYVVVNSGNGWVAPYYTASDDNVPRNQGSVLCVACHTRNPSKAQGYDNNFWGSHWVTDTFNNTQGGGGYPDSGKPNANLDNSVWFHSGNWPDVAKASKYGTFISSQIDNAVAPAADSGELICESCHNIVLNVAGKNKLLAAGWQNTDHELCVGCHGDMNAALSNEWQLFPSPPSSTWSGTAHHRNSGTADVASYYNPIDTQANSALPSGMNMNQINPAWYPDASTTGNFYQMWAVGPGSVTSTVTIAFGARARTPAAAQNGMINPTTNASGKVVVCTNCHRAHGALTTTGATILITSDNTTAAGRGIGTWTAATTDTGDLAMKRMRDHASGRAGVINDTSPLCLGCHE